MERPKGSTGCIRCQQQVSPAHVDSRSHCVKAAVACARAQVRRQFIERPGIMEYKEKPDYARCVSIVAASALRVSGGLKPALSFKLVICSCYCICPVKVLQLQPHFLSVVDKAVACSLNPGIVSLHAILQAWWARRLACKRWCPANHMLASNP